MNDILSGTIYAGCKEEHRKVVNKQMAFFHFFNEAHNNGGKTKTLGGENTYSKTNASLVQTRIFEKIKVLQRHSERVCIFERPRR